MDKLRAGDYWVTNNTVCRLFCYPGLKEGRCCITGEIVGYYTPDGQPTKPDHDVLIRRISGVIEVGEEFLFKMQMGKKTAYVVATTNPVEEITESVPLSFGGGKFDLLKPKVEFNINCTGTSMTLIEEIKSKPKPIQGL